MRVLLAASLLAAWPLAPWSPLGAQTPSALPTAVAREAAAVYNAPSTLRVIGPYELPAGDEVRGDLAVREGPVVIGGHVHGRVVAINARLTLRAGARVGGDVLVVGDTALVDPAAVVTGGVRTYADSLDFREDGDRLIPLGGDSTFADIWSRFRAVQTRDGLRAVLQTGKSYNRVEGLAVHVGPGYREHLDWGTVELEALAVVRTADANDWRRENLGHSVRAEARMGSGVGLRLTGRLYDLVEPVEAWQLSDAEAGLGAFILHRDYRDYFGTKGGGVEVGAYTGADAEVWVGWREERWRSLDARDPITLFRNSSAWRDNPAADEGKFRLATAALRVDTRNVAPDPWAGWYLVAEYEYGRGRVTSFAPLSDGVRTTTDPHVAYGRGMLDVRRYNRVSPRASLDARLLLAGWLHGDPLPAQRRLSVSGAGAMPGLDFRRTIGEVDASQCSTAPMGGLVPAGTPAQCDRVLLAQVEFRHDLRFALGDWAFGPGRLRRWVRYAQWVAFADVGRGWLVGEPLGDLRFRARELPPLDSYRTDVGLGLDLSPVGLYVSKALSRPAQDLNFVVRLQRRF